MSIHDDASKIKTPADRPFIAFLNSSKGHNLMVCIIILAVSVAGFCLGIQSSKKDEAKVTIETNPNLIIPTGTDTGQKPEKGDSVENTSLTPKSKSPTEPLTGSQTGLFVASKKGKKYYPINCAGAKSLSESNRIYFKDAAEAEAKGYTISTSCQ